MEASIEKQARMAREAAIDLAGASLESRNQALLLMAEKIEDTQKDILYPR